MVETRMFRVGVVGAGFIADSHVSVLRQLGVAEVVGACDPNGERLESLCGRWKIRYRAPSLEELLRNEKPEIVHVLVPPAYHFEVAEQSLDAGVNVFLEKPMALKTSECDLLISLARAKNLHLGVNHNTLYHPPYRRLLRDLAEGKLGKVEHVVSVNNLPLAQLTAGEHDHWMFRNPNNILFEQGPFPMSQICDLLGPVRHATTVRSGEERLRGGAIFHRTWQISLTCEGGTAQLFMSFGRSFAECWLHVIGEDAAAQIDLINNVYVLDRRTKYVEPMDTSLRRLDHARQIAWCGARGLFRYGLCSLLLRRRADAFYTGMHGSIEAFYTSMLAGAEGRNSAENGRQVIEGLTLACGAEAHRPNSDGAKRRPSRSGGCREGEILVLGGTGFIGRHLIPALAAARYPARLMVRRPAVIPETIEECGPTVYTGDIRNADDVGRAVKGCRAVIHLVAGAPFSWREFEKLFVDGTRNVAEACLKWHVSQLLFASSIAAYYLGVPRVTITEATPLDGHPERRSTYARAKIACERLLTEHHRSRGLRVTTFRPGVVIGAGGRVEHSGVGFWPSRTHCITWGSANAGLPFVLVDDVVSAMVSTIGMTGLEGTSFNLVGDVRMSAVEYINALRAESRRDIQVHRRSIFKWMLSETLVWATKVFAGKRENSFPSFRDLASRALVSEFDCTRAKEVLKWKPVSDPERFVDLGIRQALRGGVN